MTVLRSMIEGSGGDFSAKMAGKLKMWFQCFAVVGSLIALALMAGDATVTLPAWLWWFMVISIWVSLISTVHSGVLYIFGAAEFIGKSSS